MKGNAYKELKGSIFSIYTHVKATLYNKLPDFYVVKEQR